MDFEKNLESSVIPILKHIDDLKLICDLAKPDNMANSQESLIFYMTQLAQSICNVMTEIFTCWDSANWCIENDTLLFAPFYSEVIERKEGIKVGYYKRTEFKFQSDRLCKTQKKLGWVCRTFSTRTVSFLKIVWQSLIQPHIDSGSIMSASASEKFKKWASESPMKSLTKMGWETQGKNYLD